MWYDKEKCLQNDKKRTYIERYSECRETPISSRFFSNFVSFFSVLLPFLFYLFHFFFFVHVLFVFNIFVIFRKMRNSTKRKSNEKETNLRKLQFFSVLFFFLSSTTYPYLSHLFSAPFILSILFHVWFVLLFCWALFLWFFEKS